MKRILLPILLFIASATYAQKQWTATDEKVYGTQQEYNDQEAISKKVSHGNLYRLIGFKQYYANGLSLWLQERGYTSSEAPERPGHEVYIFKKNYVGSVKPENIVMTLGLNNDRISSAKIDGSFADLAQLFLYYWPTSPDFADAAKLKPGVLAQKQLVNETITFNYKGKKPVIEISRN